MLAEKKGQGALEYLLLIGGAVLIAAVVIASLTSSSGTATEVAEKRTMDSLCAPITNDTTCKATVLDSAGKWGCKWDTASGICTSETPPSAN